MKKIGVCVDRKGTVADLLTDSRKYYRANKFNPFNLSPWMESVKKGRWRELTNAEKKEVYKKFGYNLKCSFAYDQGQYRLPKRKKKTGYFCYTHRARTIGFPSVEKIPKSNYKFICSTS